MKLIRTSTVAFSLDHLLKGQLSFLNKRYDLTAVSGEDEYLEVVRNREKVRTVSIKMEREISPFKDLKSLFLLYKFFKKEQPHIVHSITPKAGLLSMVAAKFAGVPIRIHMFTGLIFPSKTGIMQKILIQMDRVLCWAATEIIPEGNGIKEDLIAFNITKKPLHILANGNVNGVDVSHFDPLLFDLNEKQALRRELNIENDDFVFVFVGRIVSDKGIHELIEAFKKVHENIKACRLLLVGPLEPERDALNQTTLDEIESNSHIISVGYQEDIRPYLAISDTFTLPSYREGFPNAVMQAGAMGLSSIVSNINGCNEIIIEAENGLIIPVKDSESLGAAMLRLINDKVLQQKLTLNARPMIVDRYEQSKIWNALVEKYEDLLSNLK